MEFNLVNNVAPKPKEWGESSRRNTQFLRSRYVLAEKITNFFGVYSKEDYIL